MKKIKLVLSAFCFLLIQSQGMKAMEGERKDEVIERVWREYKTQLA